MRFARAQVLLWARFFAGGEWQGGQAALPASR